MGTIAEAEEWTQKGGTGSVLLPPSIVTGCSSTTRLQRHLTVRRPLQLTLRNKQIGGQRYV